MRQTEQYQFNLLDGTDKLSPQPLNENMEKVEEAFGQAAQALAAAVGSGGYNARIAFGQYTGTGVSGGSQTFETGFRPVMLAVAEVTASYVEQSGYESVKPVIAVRPALSTPLYAWACHNIGFAALEWKDDAVVWKKGYNSDGVTYAWVAIGYDDSTEE